ncbi:Uncharacterised protein [Streptococcus pneumoniae]|nr:Uncharacterised protein [Streptococcus pneumoniae]
MADSKAKFTVALFTPSNLFKRFSTLFAHAAHVIPETVNSALSLTIPYPNDSTFSLNCCGFVLVGSYIIFVFSSAKFTFAS